MGRTTHSRYYDDDRGLKKIRAVKPKNLSEYDIRDINKLYDEYGDDEFDDNIELKDSIEIVHTKPR